LPPTGIDALLRALVDRSEGEMITPGFRRFLSKAERDEWRTALAEVSAWTPLGCDDAAGRGIERLGASVARVCYARGRGGADGLLVTVLYTADWRAAGVDSYRF
jgi:hypothetical protein